MSCRRRASSSAPSARSHCSSVPSRFSGSRRELPARNHAEAVVEVAHELDHRVDLVLDLVLGHEDVRVVLRDVLDAQEPVQRSAALVAMQRRGLRVADRKVAVGAKLRPEEQHVAGAVHRLQRHRLLALVRTHEEHVLLVVLVVARGDVRLEVVEERRLHLEVAALSVLLPAQILERVPDHHAFRMPERRPGRVLGEMEEVEIAARVGDGPAREPAPAARDGRRGRACE